MIGDGYGYGYGYGWGSVNAPLSSGSSTFELGSALFWRAASSVRDDIEMPR